MRTVQFTDRATGHGPTRRILNVPLGVAALAALLAVGLLTGLGAQRTGTPDTTQAPPSMVQGQDGSAVSADTGDMVLWLEQFQLPGTREVAAPADTGDMVLWLEQFQLPDTQATAAPADDTDMVLWLEQFQQPVR